jgi:hypothetical protein
MITVALTVVGIAKVAFGLAYALFSLAFVWFLGFWLTSTTVSKLDPSTWSKPRKKRLTNRDRWRSRWYRFGLPLLFFLPAFLAIMYGTYTLQVKAELSQLEGRLYPADDPDPPGPCPVTGTELALYFGRMAVVADRFPLTVIKIASKPAVVMDRNADGSLNLTLDVRSSDGRIIARLQHNGFVINQNNYLSMERKDRSSLLVKDQHGNEVLSARYMNPHAFRLSAYFVSEGRSVNIEDVPIHGVCLEILHGPEGASAINFR